MAQLWLQLLVWQPEQWNDPRLAELKDIVAGKAPGRDHHDQITLFKSNGLASEDVAAAGYVYEQAVLRRVEPMLEAAPAQGQSEGQHLDG